MTRLDKLVEELDLLSESPIKRLYNMEKDIYLVNNDVDYETDIVFNEILYFLLTDLEYGYEGYLKRLGMDDDIELLKDMIAFDCSKNSKVELARRVQDAKMEVDMGSYNGAMENKVKIYIYSAMSLLDQRYIESLIKHLINNEKIEIDFLANLINTRIEGRRKVILKV